jgi:quinol monooxygenase YgiN
MILNVVRQPVRAKYADAFPNLVSEYVAASRAEPGCLSFDWYRSTDDPNLYVLVETFVDDDAGKAHVGSAHFKAAIEQMPRWLAAAPDIIHVEVPGDTWSAVSEGTS